VLKYNLLVGDFMISNELLEEVINVSKKGKFISKGLLLRIIMNSIEQLDYVSKSNFQEIRIVNLDNDFGIANYSKDIGVIEFDYNALIKQEIDSKVFIYLKSNLLIIQQVLHEVEHLDEVSKKNKNNIQSKLISISESDFLSDIIYEYLKNRNIKDRFVSKYIKETFDRFNEKYWNVIPIEKIAEVDAFKKIIDSMENYPNFKNEHKNIYKSLYLEYLDSFKIGYKYNKKEERYNVPIYKYLKALKSLECNIKFKEICNNLSEIDSLDKFKFGFPVDELDIEKIKKQKLKIKRY